MCLGPELALALGATVGGSVINGFESNRTQQDMIDARNAATRQELERQRAFQQQSAADFRDTKNNFKPERQSQKLEEKRVETAQRYQDNAPADFGSIASGSGPQVVQTAEKKSVADAFGRANQQNAALGKLKSWDQRAFDNNLALNQGGRNLDITSDLARTSAAVNRVEQDAAYRNAYKPNSGIGDLLKFAGSVGTYNVGQGKPMFGDLFSFNKPGIPVPTPRPPMAGFQYPTAPQGTGIYPI